MRALAISDITRTGEPLLRHQFALDSLEPHPEDIDEEHVHLRWGTAFASSSPMDATCGSPRGANQPR